jgi:alcohol/geraniol dehydrogenase (NADP+)
MAIKRFSPTMGRHRRSAGTRNTTRKPTEKFQAYAASKKGGKLEPFEFSPGPLRDEQVEIEISHCGLCHSDISMIDNEWDESSYPLVPGHEVVGKVIAAGDRTQNVRVGQYVGLGWYSASCLHCRQCLSGDQHLCAKPEQTLVNRHGGFANRIRCHWVWAIPLPEKMDAAKAGPLFCAGVTVFNPIMLAGVKPTDRVGVIGIGGLGHLAVQFLNKWGCEVNAFTSTDSKHDEARELGAHHIVNTCSAASMKRIEGSLDFIISTVYGELDWPAVLKTLGPKGRLHFVGVVPDPIEFEVFDLIDEQKCMSGSPVGSPATTMTMLDFCARHGIAPVTESLPMSRVNEAIKRLRAGKARYRIVLENDF